MASVTSRTAIHDGDRQLRRTASRFGEEFRLIRLRAGVSQAAVARAIGVDRATICRLEAGDGSVTDRIRARAATALGGDFRLGLYPATSPLIHDAAHARIVEGLLRLRHSTWRTRVEAPVPGPGRRSSDLRLDRGDETVLFEVETHVHALEAIIRECEDKRAAVVAQDGLDQRIYVTLVLPPSRHHRAVVNAHPEMIGAVFPATSAYIRQALATVGEPWPGDGILWLGAARRQRRPRSDPRPITRDPRRSRRSG
jgi:transcriptional regulator with XRE-family HTH domain